MISKITMHIYIYRITKQTGKALNMYGKTKNMLSGEAPFFLCGIAIVGIKCRTLHQNGTLF